MKNIAFIILFSYLGALSFAQNLWKEIPSPVSYPMSLSRVIFMDSLTGWASGDSGIVIHTTNGGINWEYQNTGIKNNIQNLFFLDKMHGWAISSYDHTYLLKTIDGGMTWSMDSTSFKGHYLASVIFLDTLKGFISASDVPIYYTVDGGLNWLRAEIDTFAYYPGGGFAFYDHNFGFSFGGSFDIVGIIWKTTDGGIHWKGRNSGMDPIKKIHFFDSLNIFGISGDMEVGITKYVSSDGGENWEVETLPEFGFPLNLSFRTKSEAWVPLVSFTPIFYVTKDSGNTWNSYPVPGGYTIYDISFPDSLHGYAVGLDGVILKYIPHPVYIVDEPPVNVTEFSLSQNYPNPFNSSSEISFTLSTGGEVDLSLFDLLGRKIQILFKGKLEQGSHKITLDAASLPSGIYCYRLTLGTSSVIKKAVLLK